MQNAFNKVSIEIKMLKNKYGNVLVVCIIHLEINVSIVYQNIKVLQLMNANAFLVNVF